MTENSGYQAIIDAARTVSEPVEIGGTPFVVVPNDTRVHDLEKMLPAPTRARGTVTASEPESLIHYVNRHKTSATAMFADKSGHIKVVLNHHEPGAPGHGDFIVKYEAPRSREWETWTSSNGRKMTQADFARFIEDNLPDIVEPPGADVLEVARTLEAKKKVNFSSSIRLNDGSFQLTYEDTVSETKTKGNLKVPESFTLGIPVFEGADPYKVAARLRFRIDEGRLIFWFDLLRHEAVFDDAFAQIVAKVSSETSLFPFFGSV